MDLSLKSFIEQKPEFKQLERDEKIFIHPRIPLSKVQGAISAYMDGVKPDDVLILVDNTVFGGAREGLAITEKGIFFRSTPFDPIGYHVLNYVDSITCERSFFGTKLVINGSSKASLDQADRENIFKLAHLLSDYINWRNQNKTSEDKSSHSTQSRGEEPTAVQGELGFMISMIDILLHYAALNSKDCTDESANFLLNIMSFACSDSKEREMIFKSRIYAYPRPLLATSIQNFLSFQPTQEIKDSLITGLAGFLYLDGLNKEDANRYVYELGQALGMTRAQVIQALKSFLQDEEVDQDEYPDTDHDEEVIWACNILDIKTNQINRDTVTQAYRFKMKDYHPDKYQSLPEPIMRILHEKAQELNRAKDILAELY